MKSVAAHQEAMFMAARVTPRPPIYGRPRLRHVHQFWDDCGYAASTNPGYATSTNSPPLLVTPRPLVPTHGRTCHTRPSKAD